ncbi:MAG TPA: hypothetical protein VG122_22095, partial [Gemmata sp.]|nr:hypothetical protein [Gemmata sp.]
PPNFGVEGYRFKSYRRNSNPYPSILKRVDTVAESLSVHSRKSGHSLTDVAVDPEYDRQISEMAKKD